MVEVMETRENAPASFPLLNFIALGAFGDDEGDEEEEE